MTGKFAILDQWASELVVDPLSKEPLTVTDDQQYLLSPYGRKYPIVDGVYDLRLLNNETTRDQKLWKEGQLDYERLSRDVGLPDQRNDYFAEIDGVRAVYKDIPIEGSCLDVGGHQGRLRAFLAPGQRYISCDPFLDVFKDIDKQSNLTKAYPFLLDPVNFVCCDAEFLPFKSSCFDTVHMRSVVDHFLNPELALNEAYRVLHEGGGLIVGLYVHGGRSGKVDASRQAKDAIKRLLSGMGIDRYRDHHVWHPTYKELTELISKCGFEIDKVHWQTTYKDTVCYIRSTRQFGLSRL